MTTEEQRDKARMKANAVRAAHVKGREAIARGELTAAGVLRDLPSWAESLRIIRLLTATPRWGSLTARHWLVRHTVSESRRLGTMPAAMRHRLAKALDAEMERRRRVRERPAATPRPPWVPNAPLRRAFLASPLTAREVADRMGYPSGTGTSNVMRMVGLQNNAQNHKQAHVQIDTAERLAAALGIDPTHVIGGTNGSSMDREAHRLPRRSPQDQPQPSAA